MENIRTVHIIVTGKVQGVYFRASCVAIAQKLGIDGWVKNKADRNVEIMACGSYNKMEEFIKWCGQGPTGARVDDIFVEEKPFQSFENFTILRS